MKWMQIILSLIVILLFINGVLLLRQTFKTPANIRHFLFAEGDKILEGMQTGPEEITVDFDKQIATGSPLVFGGVHSPDSNQQDVWNKITDAGVTAIRRGFFMENLLPKNITYEDYKNNINDIQNPANWNRKEINELSKIFQNAKSRNMKVMGILIYPPAWLTYSNTQYGVPKDWEVYEDIVKKIYLLLRNNLDYIEIWNEPNNSSFLDTVDSGLTNEAAYQQIYYHSAKAIRDTDLGINDGKITRIGGPALSNTKAINYINNLFTSNDTKNLVDFISIHYYGDQDYSLGLIKETLAQYKKDTLPIFLTEWNYQLGEIYDQNFRSGTKAITFTGSKLLAYLNDGLTGANYYVLLPIDRQKEEKDDPYMGFYNTNNRQVVELLPQVKTWRLLSKSMKLGKGESKIFETKSSITNNQFSISDLFSDSINGLGFENVDGEKGMAIVNDSDSEKYFKVTLKNIDKKELKFGKFPIDIYIASAEYDGGKAVDRNYLQPDKNGNIIFTLLLPAKSVDGVIEVKENNLKEIIRSYIP
jgi:hypothetical protein